MRDLLFLFPSQGGKAREGRDLFPDSLITKAKEIKPRYFSYRGRSKERPDGNRKRGSFPTMLSHFCCF